MLYHIMIFINHLYLNFFFCFFDKCQLLLLLITYIFVLNFFLIIVNHIYFRPQFLLISLQVYIPTRCPRIFPIWVHVDEVVLDRACFCFKLREKATKTCGTVYAEIW